MHSGRTQVAVATLDCRSRKIGARASTSFYQIPGSSIASVTRAAASMNVQIVKSRQTALNLGIVELRLEQSTDDGLSINPAL